LVGEQEPNATPVTAQFLGDLFVDECVAVAGSLFDPFDVDSYRVLIQESLTLAVTVDHSAFVDFDILLFDAETGGLIRDCGSPVVPEVCDVAFAVRSRALAVDIVITSAGGQARIPSLSMPSKGPRHGRGPRLRVPLRAATTRIQPPL
jgi:hypothetical protein